MLLQADEAAEYLQGTVKGTSRFIMAQVSRGWEADCGS